MRAFTVETDSCSSERKPHRIDKNLAARSAGFCTPQSEPLFLKFQSSQTPNPEPHRPETFGLQVESSWEEVSELAHSFREPGSQEELLRVIGFRAISGFGA